MKRKAFRVSGGKDRKAKKEKFIFTISSEEESSTAMEPNEDTFMSETPRQTSEVSSPEETPAAETTITAQPESAVCSEKAEEIRTEDSRIPEKVLVEKSSVPEDSSVTKTGKSECVPDSSLPTFYNGPNLAEIRKRCGVTLRAIAEETKIPIRTLEDIESEKYQALPPEVYARSFVRSYAKFLSLDHDKAVREYMERYYVWKSEGVKKQRRKSSGSIFGIKFKKS